MAAQVRESREDTFDYGKAYEELVRRMKSLHLSRVSEMPRIDLYLDQVLSIISSELSFMYGVEEKVVTGAMINNYVKQRIVPAPTRKRYSRRHLAALIFVCAFKRVLSIAQIEQILRMGNDLHVDLEHAYGAVTDLLEQTLVGLFPKVAGGAPTRIDSRLELIDESGARIDSAFERLLENATIMLAYKVYADLMLELEAKGKREIESDK